MGLGAFSISLNVKDITVSKEFYETLGFQMFAGNVEQNWAIMKNGDCVIGLFQGIIEKNSLTFNPGWNQDAEEVSPFVDVRAIQNELKEKGINFITEVETDAGPGSFVIVDPDGNPILFDQHR